MVGATRRVAPTFRNDEVETQSCSEQDRWTFYETIKNVTEIFRRSVPALPRVAFSSPVWNFDCREEPIPHSFSQMGDRP